MLKENLIETAPNVIAKISSALPMATYISVLLFENGKLIVRESNNFNNWENKYGDNDMSKDPVFHEISRTKVKLKQSTVVIWDSVPHSSKSYNEMDEKRKQNGLHNGIIILEGLDRTHVLGINLASHEGIEANEFYSKVIRKKDIFLTELKKLAAIRH